MRKRRANGVGNDVVDVRRSWLVSHFDSAGQVDDEHWLSRHLTARESAWLGEQDGLTRHRAFLRLFTGKEAAHKALVQGGVDTACGAFDWLEVAPGEGRVRHLPSGTEVEARWTVDSNEAIHCVATLGTGTVPQVVWRVGSLDEEDDQSMAVRRLLCRALSERWPHLGESSSLSIAGPGQIPRVLWRGAWLDIPVSLSHDGRFVACAFLVAAAGASQQ